MQQPQVAQCSIVGPQSARVVLPDKGHAASDCGERGERGTLPLRRIDRGELAVEHLPLAFNLHADDAGFDCVGALHSPGSVGHLLHEFPFGSIGRLPVVDEVGKQRSELLVVLVAVEEHMLVDLRRLLLFA